MDGRERASKTVRQCRTRRHPDWRRARVLPDVEKPDRGDGTGLAFHPGGFRAGDWASGGKLDGGAFALRRNPVIPGRANGPREARPVARTRNPATSPALDSGFARRRAPRNDAPFRFASLSQARVVSVVNLPLANCIASS